MFMNMDECKEFIKECLEKHYNSIDDDILLMNSDVPEEMRDGGVDEDGWSKWRLTPSTVTDKDFETIENEWGVKFPLMLKAYFEVYFHYFDGEIGRVPPNKPFYNLYNAYNPVLIRCGYLPFSWDSEGYFIRCIDLSNMPHEDRCPICQIDHEVLFDYDEETVTKEDIDEDMVEIEENLKKYFEKVLIDNYSYEENDEDEYDEEE